MHTTVIIDDQKLFRDGFKLLLSSLPKYEFDFVNLQFDDLLVIEAEVNIDIIFIQLNERLMDSMSDLKKLRKKFKNTKIAVLSIYDNTKLVREAFQCGIDAYFLKDTSIEKIGEGLGEILEGRTFMTEGLRLTPKKGHQPKAEVRQNLYNDNFQIKQKLTKRENEVLALIVLAQSNKEIGKNLFISEQTVGVHKKNIMRKLSVHNTVSLIRFAIDNNLA